MIATTVPAAAVTDRSSAAVEVAVVSDDAGDSERRFGGLRRLYGDAGYARVRTAHVVVVGLGGVGSWAVEALARSGVAALTLVDLDHVAESNINRQVQALGSTLGQAKAHALRNRIADIHPGCDVQGIEEFVDDANWPGLLATSRARPPPHAVIDACDQVRAKATLAAWCRANAVPLVCVGAAGGRRQPALVQVGDLAQVTHDPLLAALRHRLRRHHAAPSSGAMQVTCVHSREAADPLASTVDAAAPVRPEAGLNCQGYGSSVAVTATFGMVAAAEVLNALAAGRVGL